MSISIPSITAMKSVSRSPYRATAASSTRVTASLDAPAYSAPIRARQLASPSSLRFSGAGSSATSSTMRQKA